MTDLKTEVEEQFYVIHNSWSGDAMVFWREGRAGYTADWERVHKFTLEEAQNTARKSERIFNWNELDKLTSKVINPELKQEVWKHEITKKEK